METRYGYDGQHAYKPITKPTNVNDNSNQTSNIMSIEEIKKLLQPCYPKIWEELKLFPCQIDCYNTIIKAFKRQYSILNVAPTRSGKTPTTLAVCRALKLIPFIVAPRATENDWEMELNKYGFYDHYFTGYEALAGKGTSLKHKYLTKNEKGYEATPYFRSIVDRGILLIFDEVQCAKNDKTNNNKACHALTKMIVSSSTQSRILVMSATPYDKIEFSKSILKLLGLIQADKMYEYDNKLHDFIFMGYGFHELICHADKIDSSKTTEILDELDRKKTKKNIDHSAHKLFTQVLLGAYVAKIIPNFPTRVDAYNGYFKVSPESLSRIKEFEKQLTSVTGYDEKTNTVSEKIDFGKLIKIIHELEHVKTEILIRLTHAFMQRDSNTKMILYVWHHDTADYLYQQLQMYNPSLINGKININKRADSISVFQQPDTECRLLIANPVAGGVGLALDDQDGNFPRVILMIPMFHFNTMTQALARTRGMLTKSHSQAFIIYAKSQTLEQKIIDILLLKEKVTRSVVGEDSQIITPGRLQRWDEPTY